MGEREALRETAEILADPDAMVDLELGFPLIDDGRTVRVAAILHRSVAYGSDPR